jgi:SAM-dependent methyltransferase
MNIKLQPNTKCVCCNSNEITNIFSKENFDYFKCNNCGLIFIYPVPLDLEKVYTKEYFTGGKEGFGYVNYDNDKEPMRSTFIKYLNLLEKLYPQKGDLLDIGAASGFFMQMAKDRGWRVRGIEISDYAAELGRSKGLDVRTDSLDSANFGQNSFDVITVWDVLEHLPDPESSLKKINSWLKTDGLLAVNTPDSSSWYAKIMGKKWHLYIPPEHIFHFTPTSLQFLGKRFGFDLVISTKIGKKFTIQYILVFVQNWLNLSKLSKIISRISISPLGRLALPVNLRDNFVAILKKTRTTFAEQNLNGQTK